MKPSLIHIYQGDGKGKTTAAMGLATRALGAGLRVGIACFLKDGGSSELSLLRSHESCTVLPCPPTIPFSIHMTDDDKVRFGAWYCRLMEEIATIAPRIDVLILDEILDAIDLGFVKESVVVSLCTANAHPEIVMTGRKATTPLLEKADYITTMHADRHPFQNGITARHGIEF